MAKKDTFKKLSVAALFTALSLGSLTSLKYAEDTGKDLILSSVGVSSSKENPAFPITSITLVVLALYVGVYNRWAFPVIGNLFTKATMGDKIAYHEAGHLAAYEVLDAGVKCMEISILASALGTRSILLPSEA